LSIKPSQWTRTPSHSCPTPPVRSSSPDLGVYHLAPLTEGYELEAWKSWCALREVRATDSFNVTKLDCDDWRRHRDDYVSRKLAKETEDRLSIAMVDDLKAAKAAELLRKALTKPEHYDGNRAKFADWWADLQLYLKGFSELSHEAQIITALGFFTKGDAATWARVKKEEALADKLRSWEVFASDVEVRFSDPIHAQKALNEIHNFTQGRRQVAEYLDQFEILKTISTVGNDEALYLVK
jgi:hypothetical protein